MAERRHMSPRVSNRRSFVKNTTLGLFAISGVGVGAGYLRRNGWSADAQIVRVSTFAQGASSTSAAIEAAIREAGSMGGAVVDFEDRRYVVDGSVVVRVSGVTLANGFIEASGPFPALIVSAPDVVCQKMSYARSRDAAPTDSSRQRSCVVIEAGRFKSIDCDYKSANHACLYLAHGLCDGAVITGGHMSGTVPRQDASGIYAAPGRVGNRNITVEGVRISGTTQGILLFDTSDSLLRGNLVEHLRVLPTVNLRGWTHVSGDVWRQRTAPGQPGVDGAQTDRVDGNTRVVSVDDDMLGEVAIDVSRPDAYQASIEGGYVYLNLGGIDPNTRSIRSGILSGYACTIYATDANEHLCTGNTVIGNRLRDIDGIGIYLQLGNYPGGRDNRVAENVLHRVCLEGAQHKSLAFGGIGVGGGNDTSITGNFIHEVGSSGKPVPGVAVIPGMKNENPGGHVYDTTVIKGSSQGFQISASNWKLDSCRAADNADSGFVVWANTTGARVRNVTFYNCTAWNNGGEGFNIAGITPSIDYLSVRIEGGTAASNARRGVLVDGSDEPTVQDCAIVDLRLLENGTNAEHPQIALRKSCLRTVVGGCDMQSTADGAVGLRVEAGALETVVGRNHYELSIPEILEVPVLDEE